MHPHSRSLQISDKLECTLASKQLTGASTIVKAFRGHFVRSLTEVSISFGCVMSCDDAQNDQEVGKGCALVNTDFHL